MAAKRRATSGSAPSSVSFSGTIQRTISRDEIYPISALLHGLTLEDLYININKASQTYYPAWNSLLFHGVQIPWISQKPIAIGIKDLKTFGDLINSTVLSYQHAGWKVV